MDYNRKIFNTEILNRANDINSKQANKILIQVGGLEIGYHRKINLKWKVIIMVTINGLDFHQSDIDDSIIKFWNEALSKEFELRGEKVTELKNLGIGFFNSIK